MDPDLEQWRAGGTSFDYLGFRVFYRHEGDGPPLLLIHGYPFSSFDWAPLWPELTSRFTVIAPDMLGMGFSDKPAAYAYSVPDHAHMHLSLLRSLGVERCHILAHDLGDSVGQELLARHELGEPGVAIDSITWLNGGLFNEAYRPRPIQKLLSATPLGGVFARYRRVLLAPRLMDARIAEMFGPRTKPSSRLLAQFNEILDYHDGRRVTHRVGRFVGDRRQYRNRWVRAMRETSVPMRLIDGPADPNSGRHLAERYLELIPQPDVVILADEIGHWPQIEAPREVLDHFLAFIGDEA
jgi:pimeloyl-ACP methyl ester carboxylesterase